MVTRDPAIEAARRAKVRRPFASSVAQIDAAREALAPIRDLHFVESYAQGPDYCAECEHRWPCPTARIVYTTEELNHD